MSVLSSTKYLQPEYLSPAESNKADSKTSPLAMLVATCNSIGSENSKVKPVTLSSKELKHRDSDSNGGRVSVTSTTSGGPRSPISDRDRLSIKSVSPKRERHGLSSPEIHLKSPNHIRNSVSGKHEDSELSRRTSVSPVHKDTKSDIDKSIDKPITPLNTHSTTAPSALSKGLSEHSIKADSGQTLPGLAHYAAHMSMAAGLPSLPGYPYSLLGSSLPAALLAAHKHNPETVKYTPVRTASGATTLLPLCSDPYCTQCKLTLQAVQLSPTPHSPQCPAGCVQCTHDKVVGLPANYPATTASSLSPSGLLGLHGLGPFAGLAPSSLLQLPTSPSSGLSSSAAQPHVCSWISSTGTGVCGKRFGTSEDLMQHLRSHTTALDSALPPPAHVAPPGLSAYAPSPLATAAQVTSHAASHLLHSTASSINPALLRQAYSGRLSPGLLSSSRYHPYLKSIGGSDAPLASLHPSLSAYSSLYSLYGHKLGVP